MFLGRAWQLPVPDASATNSLNQATLENATQAQAGKSQARAQAIPITRVRCERGGHGQLLWPGATNRLMAHRFTAIMIALIAPKYPI